jgi:hypothetical protein
MTTHAERDRYAPPGSAPTDEDLRHELELTRRELGDTLTELMRKLDVKSRTREATQRRLTELHEATNRTRTLVRTHPAVVLTAGLALTATVAALVVLRLRH